MSSDELLAVTRQRPFEPFRLVVSDGSAYDVPHPDLLWVGQKVAYVGLTGSASRTLFERSVRLDLGHITQIVPIDAATPPAQGAGG